MPPRRSCFYRGDPRDSPDSPVSMPPRRSCFRRSARARPPWTPVSMPPRRSCFASASPRETSPLKHPFQCHHGVPASRRREMDIEVLERFQCHHGVPASRPERGPDPSRGKVSMPPRRSCFPIIPRDRGLLSSLGGDVERDGDRWVRTSVGFDGHFTLSSLSHHRGSAEALSDPPLIRTFYIPKRRSSLHRMDRRSRVPSPCYASLDDPSADPRSPDFPWGSADDF